MTEEPAKHSQALELLRVALDAPEAEFREGQWEAISALAHSRQKMLIVQRTGWGKSTVYFISTRILRDRGAGPTLIISPLLALMRNQIEAADRLGIRAATINSSNTNEWEEVIGRIDVDEIDALLISPERLSNDEFIERVLLPLATRIGLLVVDEAHCISDWGHDFRPDYQRLSQVLRRLPDNIPVVGTTATANDRVIEDVQEQLGNVQVQRGPLMRSTLELQTLRLPDRTARLAWLADHMDELPGTGIVYVLTRRDADQVVRWLKQNGISAAPYYSDVRSEEFQSADQYRIHLEDLLSKNKLKALVATSALGMGYDKPDLGFVVHYQTPGSVIAYYQQVGRAGRAIDRALGILFSGSEDAEIQAFFRRSAFPDERDVNAILEALEVADGMSVRGLEAVVNLRLRQIEHVLKFLSVQNPAPVYKQDSEWFRTAVPWMMDHEHIRRLTRQREQEWEEIQAYINAKDCLMEFLARALDDPTPAPCGRCSNCRGEFLIGADVRHETATSAALFLRHSEFELVCNKQVAAGAFTEYGFRGNLPVDLRADIGRVLSRWGDAGWGKMVETDKHAGRFRNELVEAMAEMIQQRWNPDPAPAWVTCIPSNRHPELVPDFARRLADILELPFMPVVQKVRENEPQKMQRNRFRQCSNLDGVFQVPQDLPKDPCLLVDDIVDSGWTLTVVAILLRESGSGPVYPVALASSSPGS